MANLNDDDGLNLFGFTIKRKNEEDSDKTKSFVPKDIEDGAQPSSAAYNAYHIDIDPSSIKNSAELISKYREISLVSEMDLAISEIIDEVIVVEDDVKPIDIDFAKDDSKKFSDKTKELVRAEFDEVIRLMKFNNNASDIFRNFYIDGSIAYHKIIDKAAPKKGVIELRQIDVAKLKKVVELKKEVDPTTRATIITGQTEYFLFTDNLAGTSQTALKISTDAIAYTTSGVIDRNTGMTLSHLHKAIRPMNQLRMMEDSDVIYRMSRAPERRVFYIDTSGMARTKAEQYVNSVMAKYKNKQVYDITTGTVKDSRKHTSILEDFWLPRANGGKGTEITTLPGGSSLGSIENTEYFQQSLYRSLNIPLSRLQQPGQGTFNLGRGNEISRDEIKFAKFISKLRRRFNNIFIDILKTQLLMKGITTEEDWELLKESLVFVYNKDNFWAEIKKSEMLRDRLQTVGMADIYVGKYFSKNYIMKELLTFTDEEVNDMLKEIETEGPPPEQQGNV